MSEWIISVNPEIYDVINAFRNLGTIDWHQSIDMEVGDIVYIYVSGDVNAIRFRCRVNAVDLDDVTIDSSDYYVSDEFEENYRRYIILEMLEEYKGDEFSSEVLNEYGFSIPLGTVKMSNAIKIYINKIANSEIENKRFSVNEAVWIAAASKAFINYNQDKDFRLENCFLNATELQKIASEYTENDVRTPRIYQHCNGDHENCTHRFLRRIEKNNNNVEFRVTAKGEFNDKKYIPSELIWDEKIVVDGEGIILKELKYFIEGQYREMVVKSMNVLISDEDALWVVLSCMTYNACLNKIDKFNEEDVLFDTDIILENTMKVFGYNLSLDSVDGITSMLNSRGIHFMVELDGKRRISYMSEFKCVKECPSMDVINSLPMLEMDGKTYDVKSVYSFVNREYTERARILFKKEIDESIGNLEREVHDMNKEKKEEFDKNLILYGPPGTGKTYHSAIYAVAICDGVSMDTLNDYDAVMKRYNQLKAEHRIAFTTFHQSYGYEEFIEGIKPNVDEESKEVSYTIEPGVFKRFCEIARCPSNINVNPNAQIWFMRLEDNMKNRKEECFCDGELTIDIKENDEWSKERFVNSMQIGDYVISYAGNSVYIDAIGVIESEANFDDTRNEYKWIRKVKWYKLPEKKDIKSINEDKYLPNFSIAKMKHIKLSDLLRLLPQETETNEKPYVFVIDEINRGNISKIFGELITLIENTKREGMSEAASAILPYSGQAFSVPSNVYIIGTMNTADRSIALMDTALRRRFQFKEMMPDSKVLIKIGADKINEAGIELNVAAMLETINERIEYLFDREHTIGHAFFTSLKKEPTVSKLASIFKKSVIPLLQEYFYEDYSKIMLVLGDNGKTKDSQKFIIAKEIKPNSIFRGDTSDIDLPDCTYEIQEEAFDDIMSYIEIMG